MSIETIDQFLRPHFGDPAAVTPYSDEFLQDFLRQGPLHYFIPEALGGAESDAIDAMRVMETTAYHALPLGLTMGITGSLFLRPMAKLASPALRDQVLAGFLKGSELGGMMITEPTGGTDIFGLQTTFRKEEGHAILNGAKCWGGLTGRAEHWLVAARAMRGERVTKRVDLVYVPLNSEGMDVDTYFEALGLQPIPYGLTRYVNVRVPESHVITAGNRSALRDLYDILFRSRLVISAIAGGHCRRLADEAEARSSSRVTFGAPIGIHDQVQFRVAEIRATEQINRALWNFGAAWMNAHTDISGDYLLINAAKVVSTDGLALAADDAFHIFASAAFKRTHLVGRSYTDVRPFRIFEGVNDVLHENTYDVLASRYPEVNRESIDAELQRYGLSFPDNVPTGVIDALPPPDAATQRQRVVYGDLVSWLTVLAILQQAPPDAAVDEGLRLLLRHLAGRAAELPYVQ